MRCHYAKDAEIGRYFLPNCMGGAVYGPRGCTCPQTPRARGNTEIDDLRRRVARLEKLVNEAAESGFKKPKRVTKTERESDTLTISDAEATR